MKSEKQKAVVMAKIKLVRIKMLLSALNKMVAEKELLPVTVYNGKKLTSILDISVQCDEQIGLLDDVERSLRE